MTPKRKIDIGVFAAGGALLLYGGVESRRGPFSRTSWTKADVATLAGWGLAAYGAFRVSPIVGVGTLLGLAAVEMFVVERVPGDVRETLHAALKKENDPDVLREFAGALRDAGYARAADSADKRAAEIAPQTVVGQTHTEIAKAQRLLRILGYDVPIDGFLGPRTIKAIEHFQSLHDLDIDGIPGRETLLALRSAVR
jgi:hypothetical protein